MEGHRIRLPLLGLHQAANAMLAWALVQELGLDPAPCAAEALRTLRIPGGRGEVIEAGGLTIINDAYNANPASFLAAIGTARAMRGGRRLVFVAGTMRELGRGVRAAPCRRGRGAGGARTGAAGGGRGLRPGAAALRRAARVTGCSRRPTRQPWGRCSRRGCTATNWSFSKHPAARRLERILPYLTGQDHPTH